MFSISIIIIIITVEFNTRNCANLHVTKMLKSHVLNIPWFARFQNDGAKEIIYTKKKTVKRDVHLNETKSFEKFGVVLRLITSGHL